MTEHQAAVRGTLFDLGLLDPRERDLNEARIRALCNTVRVSDDDALCRVLGRYKMYVDLRDGGLSPHLMMDGLWEIWNTEAVLGFVRPGMTVVDVGANLGYFTILMAELVGDGGHVHAVEPNPRMMGLLRRSVGINGYGGRVTCHDGPVSATVGERVRLHVPAGRPQNGHMRADDGPGALATTTIDALVGGGPVDFIKIDAEGAEQAIWQGMRGVLARGASLAVMIEFTPDRYADPRAFLHDLLEGGFALSIVDHRAGVRAIDVDGVLAGAGTDDRMLVVAR